MTHFERSSVLTCLAALAALSNSDSCAARVRRIPTIPVAGVQDELLPERLATDATCSATKYSVVRAILVGIDDYPQLFPNGESQMYSDMHGSKNDAELLAAVLKREGVTDLGMFVATVSRATFVHRIMQVAQRSRCGDVLLFYFAGYPLSQPTDEYLLFFSDAVRPADPEAPLRDFPSSRPLNSPTQRHRRVWPGTVDANELHDYFDRLRANGVNVFVILDTNGSSSLINILRSPARDGEWALHARGSLA
jgi:Caspase domain